MTHEAQPPQPDETSPNPSESMVVSADGCVVSIVVPQGRFGEYMDPFFNHGLLPEEVGLAYSNSEGPNAFTYDTVKFSLATPEAAEDYASRVGRVVDDLAVLHAALIKANRLSR